MLPPDAIKFDKTPSGTISIHFKTIEHRISLDTFIETATHAKGVIDAFNSALFGDELIYEINVEPPEAGTFLSKLSIVLATGGAILGFLATDIGKSFVRGLTDQEPAYWAEFVGAAIKSHIDGSSDKKGEPDGPVTYDDVRYIESCILAYMVINFLAKNEIELSKIGIGRNNFREGYRSKNLFYISCLNDQEVKGIGFQDEPQFPISRQDFPHFIVDIPTHVSEEESQWQVGTAEIRVTSPNWDRNDKHRSWKGKDVNNKERLFSIEDQEFWRMVERRSIIPDIIDTITIQWAFDIKSGRPKNFRALRVIEYNGQIIGSKLDENALRALLGEYNTEINGTDQMNLGI